MIVVTTDLIPGREIVETLGLVRGNSVRARHALRVVAAVFKQFFGGEVHEYTKLLAETREQALDRMLAEARAQGADAVVGVRFASSEISAAAAEFMAYGTAVKLAPKR
ncbi:MAG: heavy metal-binding domain-containing protein [Planctomycetes bacterium]|nr:heavy metal-binding domain-containing protein [Planctomycetota bacterium]